MEFRLVFQQARVDNEERTRLAREATATCDKPTHKRLVNKRSQVNFDCCSSWSKDDDQSNE